MEDPPKSYSDDELSRLAQKRESEMEGDPETFTVTHDELLRRIGRYDRGEAAGIPAEEVFREADCRLSRGAGRE